MSTHADMGSIRESVKHAFFLAFPFLSLLRSLFSDPERSLFNEQQQSLCPADNNRLNVCVQPIMV
jgi:hypothetical protein